MEDETTFSYPENFNYSALAHKYLGTKEDVMIDRTLKLYNISRSSLETMIAGIQDWYSKQPHLPQGQLHDRMVLGHLIARAFSVEQCKEHIDNYFAARHKMPDVLCGWSPMPNSMQKYIREGYLMAPITTTKENYRVVLFRLLDPTDFSFLDTIRTAMMLRDYRLFNDPVPGEHWVLDLTNLNMSIVMQATPTLFAKLFYYCTACYATKLKGIHLINLPQYAHSVLAILKKVLKEKHLSRLYLHNSYEELYNMIPREIFPKDIGGSAEYTCQDLIEVGCQVIEDKTWKLFYEHQQKYFYTDESKRVTPAKNNEYFGLDGSFRKLEVD